MYNSLLLLTDSDLLCPPYKLSGVLLLVLHGKPLLGLHQAVQQLWLGEDGVAGYADIIEDTRSRSPEDQIHEAIEIGRMHELIDKLETREARILRLRFGLGNGEPMTLKAIGKRYGLTRERVRQMEQNVQNVQKHLSILI